MFAFRLSLIIISIFWYASVNSLFSPNLFSHRLAKRQTDRESSCVVPAVFADKTFVVNDFNGELIENAAPGSKVSGGAYLEFKCSHGYLYEDGGSSLKSYCSAKGEWQPRIKPCTRLCPALQASNMELTCNYKGHDVDCNRPLLSGTVVTPRCSPFYHVSYEEPTPPYTSLRCRDDGQWNEILFKCDPDCGISKGEVSKTVNGNVMPGQIPWNVAIYSTASKENKFVCSGTLIAPNAVLSAAHCFYDEKKAKVEPKNHVVVVETITQKFKNLDGSGQKELKVSEIILSEHTDDQKVNGYPADIALVILQESVTVSSSVLPACFNAHTESGFDPPAGTKGLLVGWGLDAKDKANEILQIVQVKSIPHDECSVKLAGNMSDKLCVSSERGSKPLKGFNGGGLVFQDANKKCYYIRGIVSAAEQSSDASVIPFTDISYYQEWIGRVLQERKDCARLSSPKYRGCYEMTDKSSLLNERVSNFSTTLELCVEFCSVRDYPFAGVEKQQCRCGHHVPSELQKRSDSECNYPCQSSCQSMVTCGGKSKVSIYETGVKIVDAIPVRTYLGCFKDDDPNARVLNGTWNPFYCDNSPKKCHQHCFSTGFRYFGLTYFHECFCGDTAPSVHKTMPESECNNACSGNSKEMCGGGWRLSVYTTGITDQPEVGRSAGCVKKAPGSDFTQDIKFALSPVSITNRRCLNLCTFKGYKYSAVVDQNLCTCTNTAPLSSSLDDSLSCEKQECLGDPTEMCGAVDREKVYRTRYEDTETKEKVERMGCYEDHTEFGLIDDYAVSVDESLSGELCADICKNKGFAFSGVKSGNQCFCGNAYPPSFLLRSESDCTLPCLGNPSDKCGGASAVSVYQTGLSHNQARVSKVYMGCFKDEEVDKQLFNGFTKQLRNNAPNVCHKLCLKNGFLYFGLTPKVCMCGDEDPTTRQLVSGSECIKECAGDANQKCGGVSRLSVYKTGLEALLLNKTQYLGCFPTDGHSFKEYSVLLLASNTPTRCYRICDQLGFLFAGTENGNLCRCGNNKPKHPVEKDDKKCDSKCSGSSAENCGGNNYIKILQTRKQL